MSQLGSGKSAIGFIGLGLMGEPMALNLLRSGAAVTVWNRTRSKCGTLRRGGAAVANTPSELFARCPIVILMLANEEAMDSVLARFTEEFESRIAGRTIVHMGTTTPEYSAGLEEHIKRAGGCYVEAPVSGSRKPAEDAELVIMIAGDEDAARGITPLLSPMCKSSAYCGPVPSALLMKLSVNLFLITMVTGLAEAVHFARRNNLDLELLRSVLDAGPMASAVSKVKLGKLVSANFEPQASTGDVLKNNRLVAEAARNASIASPLLDMCHELYAETVELGHGSEDMVAVIRAIEARSGETGAERPLDVDASKAALA